MSSLSVEEDQKWAPTHVQVTVLRGRGLRGKGKHGTSDVYAVIQLGKEKYSTCVAEKTTAPEWREECTFELQQQQQQQPGASEGSGLVLTVMHRTLMGLDVFLGQAVIQLEQIFHESSRCVKNEWYRLNSKTGKKEKERGDIQVTIQFTRNNLTASMYDLVMKDKAASAFGKLKERMRGKRRSGDDDSASGVLPGGHGSLSKVRQRLPSDGGGEEDYEDDEGGEVRRSKMRTFFLRGKLRKSSDTRSSTSLGSESSESSSRGGSLSPTAGISVVVSDLSNSPSNSSNLITADNSPERSAETSPKSPSSLQCEFGDDPADIAITVPQRTVCVNESHAYSVRPMPDPGSGEPPDPPGLGPAQKPLPLSVSLQNLSPRSSTGAPEGPVGDGRRWSFDKPGEEEKAAIAAALEQSGPMLCEEAEEKLGRAAPTAASSTAELEIQGNKERRNLSAGKGQNESERGHEVKLKGWFGSKDSHSKPSLVVSPKLEPRTHSHPPLFPHSHHPYGPPVEPASLVSPLHHSNPFRHSPSTPPPISPCNPFFSLLQPNPFREERQLKPPLPCLSSSRPLVASLSPQTTNPNPTQTHDNPTAWRSTTGADAKEEPIARVDDRPLLQTPTEGGTTSIKRASNPFFVSPSETDPNSEWDESFEAFAAGRLQSPEELTAVGETQENTHPPLDCSNKEAAPPTICTADQYTNVTGAPYHRACAEFEFMAQKAASQVTNNNSHHFDAFTQFLETIPEQASFESDSITLNSPGDSQNLAAYVETNEANSAADADDLTDANMHRAPGHTSSVKYDITSSDPGSSGLGSLAEEDVLSSLSFYSDKFSASSSEEAETPNSESNILSSENCSQLAVVKRPSESDGDITETSNDLSLVFLDQHRDGDESVDLIIVEGSVAPPSSVLAHPEPMIAAGETLAPGFSELKPKCNVCLKSEDENGEKETGELNASPEDFSKVLSASSKTHTTDVMTAIAPDEDLCSVIPSLHITTSSPNVTQTLLDLPVEGLGGQDARLHSPIPFGVLGDFLSPSHFAKSPSPGLDGTPLHAPVSNQSSFLQSFYVSVDSTDYQTCESHPFPNCSGGSETSETLQSTLCGEIQSTAGAALGQEGKPSNEDIHHSDQLKKLTCRAEDNSGTLEQSFTIGDDFSSEVPPMASAKHSAPHGEFWKSPQTPSVPLHRSQSEGKLTPTFDELLLPSLRSVPGSGREDLPPSHSGPDLLSLTSFAPCLTPDSSSSPVALRSLPPLVDAPARSPAGAAGAAVPNPVPPETQQEQAASRQSSPHPVRPLTTAMLAEEKRTEGRSVLATGLEKLKSTIHPGRSSQVGEQDTDRKKSVREGAGSYYHLNHGELVALLVQREAELERQREEFERQRCLLAKREVELRRLKPQVKDLEDYIDTLLVRIMEQTPTLLQVRSKLK